MHQQDAKVALRLCYTPIELVLHLLKLLNSKIMNTQSMLRMPVVNFIFNRRKTANKGHKASVEVKICYDRKAKYMSTGIQLLPKEWNKGTITNRPDAQELNKTLEKMRINVLKVINDMIDEHNINIFEIPDRINSMLGEKGKSFLEFCHERLEVRVYGKSDDSKERYERFMRWFEKWGKIRYFSDVTDKNVLAMDAALKDKNMKDNSKWNNYHRFLNSFILDAVDAGLLKHNPYKWLHINKEKNVHSLQKFLTLEEMRRFETTDMKSECLNRVRDLFVFQTYTCLSYVDMAAFDFTKVKDIGDGHKMYTGKRGKTHQEYSFVILSPAMKVLKKYNYKLPLISNVKYNQYIKVCAQMAGIDKPLTTHWARHTGATIMLNEGVDMEVVAKILGHSSTKITRQIYAKLMDKTVANKMIEAEKKMNKML